MKGNTMKKNPATAVRNFVALTTLKAINRSAAKAAKKEEETSNIGALATGNYWELKDSLNKPLTECVDDMFPQTETRI
jgi:hypothetical protein